MAIRGGVVCQGVAEIERGRISPGKFDHRISYVCAYMGEKSIDCHPPRRELIQSIHHTSACHFTKGELARLEGALNERWVLTPTQTQEIPPPSNTITAVISHSICRL